MNCYQCGEKIEITDDYVEDPPFSVAVMVFHAQWCWEEWKIEEERRLSDVK